MHWNLLERIKCSYVRWGGGREPEYTALRLDRVDKFCWWRFSCTYFQFVDCPCNTSQEQRWCATFSFLSVNLYVFRSKSAWCNLCLNLCNCDLSLFAAEEPQQL